MELLRPYNDKYEEKGIRFVLGRGEDEEEVWRFIVEEFIPDEPVTRSLGFLSGETWVDRYARAELRKFFTGQCLGKANSHSVLALDGSEIVGVKLGFRLTTACQPHPFSYSKWMEYLYWALPQKVVDLNVFSSYYEGPGFRYHPNLALEDLRVDSLFEGAVLCVGREARYGIHQKRLPQLLRTVYGFFSFTHSLQGPWAGQGVAEDVHGDRAQSGLQGLLFQPLRHLLAKDLQGP